MKKEGRDKKESRKHPRYTKIINVDATVDRFPDDIVGEKAKLKEGQNFRATTINVSESGILINCDFLFPERTTIIITVNDTQVADREITVKTSIAWTKRNAYKIFGRYSAGLHIVEADQKDINLLIAHFN